MRKDVILLAHGNGGKLTHGLIKSLFLKKLNNPLLSELSDSARIPYREQLGFTTDSFVVSPLEFPGGDIGKLAVCGTVNDLVMLGCVPEFLSLALIIEEGLRISLLERIVDSIASTARAAGVKVATGDLKVVEKGSCDKIFINTSGIGRIIKNSQLSTGNIEAGDSIIISSAIAQHGLAILSARKDFNLGFRLKSDCACLNHLLIPLVEKTDAIKFMRDPTRGGLATTLCEIAESANLGVLVEENRIPVKPKVRFSCELLGLDPLYLANEAQAVLAVRKGKAEEVLRFLRRHPLGKDAEIIGHFTKDNKKTVVLDTAVGSQKIIGMLADQPLPRIC